MFRQEIILDLKKTLESLGLIVVEPNLEHPAEETHGDYSTNIAMVAFRVKGHALAPAKMSFPRKRESRLREKHGSPIRSGMTGEFKTPLSLAQAIAANFPPADYLEKIEAVPPGFINFFLKPDYIYNSIVAEILKQGDDYGQTDLLKGKKIMVEFAHPNTHKMFHIGHLRNVTTGESIVRILEANKAKVIRANYQGDVGLHIAKALYGISPARLAGLKTLNEKIAFLGKAYAVGAKAYEEDEKAAAQIRDINYLVYASAQRFQEENGLKPGSTDYLKFVEGRGVDVEKIYKLWKETRVWSLAYFEKIYKRVDTRYDRFYFESECLSGVDLAILASQDEVLQKSDGAIIFNGKPYGLDTRVFVNSLGLPTYEGKELALAAMEFSEFGKLDKLIHVVGPEQASFFKVTFKVEELLDPERYKDKQFHLVYGWVKLKKGKMSSRTGQVVLGEWLLDEAKKRLQEKFKMEEETAEVVAVGAVKYSLLRVGLSSEISFDIDESINLEGDSGPYLQYVYVRCMSVLRKFEDNQSVILGTSEARTPESKTDSGHLPAEAPAQAGARMTDEEMSLLRSLYRFPEIVVSAGIKYSPNLLCGYLFDLAKKYNLFYNKCPILNPEPQKGRPFVAVREIRLRLTKATGQILKNGLYFLGIKVVEKM